VEVLPLLSMITGFICVIVFAFHLEQCVQFVPLSVVQGFAVGVSFSIAANQLDFALGLPRCGRPRSRLGLVAGPARSDGQATGSVMTASVMTPRLGATAPPHLTKSFPALRIASKGLLPLGERPVAPLDLVVSSGPGSPPGGGMSQMLVPHAFTQPLPGIRDVSPSHAACPSILLTRSP
jgi:hypothetical protein